LVARKDLQLEYIESAVKIEETINYDLDLIDNFGIADSLSSDYVSQVLPEEIKKVGILSDIHFPYHSLEALTIAIKHLRQENIDCLYLNGDIMDFYSISRHEKDKDLRDFKREVDMSRDSKNIVTIAHVGTIFLVTIFSKNLTSCLYLLRYLES